MNVLRGLQVDPAELAQMATRLAQDRGGSPLATPATKVPDPVTWLADRNPALASMFRECPDFPKLVMQQAVHLAMQAREQKIPYSEMRLGPLQPRGTAGAFYDVTTADGRRVLARDTHGV